MAGREGAWDWTSLTRDQLEGRPLLQFTLVVSNYCQTLTTDAPCSDTTAANVQQFHSIIRPRSRFRYSAPTR